MRRTSQRNAGLKHGWRSGLEELIAEQLKGLGAKYRFEALVVPFVQPVKPRRYTPDFILPNGIIIETKGRFVTADRQKHKLVKEQHPNLDIRFVFSNSKQRISKQSKTTYATWCQTYGFKYADKLVPTSWVFEVNEKSIAAIRALKETE